MKILFIAMDNSIHTYRWIQNILGSPQRHDLFLFPSFHIAGSPLLFKKEDRIHIYIRKYYIIAFSLILRHPVKYLKNLFSRGFFNTLQTLQGELRQNVPFELERFIKRCRPDIIHTMHTQTSGYLLAEVRKNWKGPFPKWVHSVWGSDFYLYRKWPHHRLLLSALLSFVDYFIAEGDRDQKIAAELGYQGRFLEPIPAFGGFDLELAASLRAPSRPSQRKQISIKGYQNAVGRYFVGLRALERIRDLLDGYEINVYLVENEISQVVTELFEIDNSLKVNVLRNVPYEQILEMHARSRVSIGLSTSDGLPSSFLEAMAMGSFPIQTETSLASEWVTHGSTAFLVPPNDPEIIENALRTVLLNDQLVDRAAELNWEVIKNRLSDRLVSNKIINIYNHIEASAEND